MRLVLGHLRRRIAAWVALWFALATWRRARKFAVALLGVLAQLLVAGVVPAPWDARAQLLLALATALGVYQVPNEPRAAAAA